MMRGINESEPVYIVGRIRLDQQSANNISMCYLPVLTLHNMNYGQSQELE